jgi:lipopolysaccharide export system permease protein
MLLNQVAKRFGALIGKGLPWSVITEVFVLSVPFILAMTLPMAVLVASWPCCTPSVTWPPTAR